MLSSTSNRPFTYDPKFFGIINNHTKSESVLRSNLPPSILRARIPPAETFRLLELVGYQEGSVVSRTLIDRSAGTVTLFAFDENQGLSPHTSPYDALVQVLEGEADITISGKPNRVKEGELILMPSGQSHAVNAVRKFKMLLIRRLHCVCHLYH